MPFKTLLRKIKYSARPALYWARTDIPNWGDDLNPWLFERLSGRKPIYCPHTDIPRLLMAGSILDHAGPKDTCWGSGFIDENTGRRIRLASVAAVRGPLTAKILGQCGSPTSNVFGDPGLLAAGFVETGGDKTHRWAVVPHYIDFAQGTKLAAQVSASVVPVSLPIEEFVRQIASAERVFSSSLHGLICAESLGIPAVWVKFSENVLGGNFKFHDYIAGTDRNPHGVYPLDFRSDYVSELTMEKYPVLDKFDLSAVADRLLKAFPAGLSSDLAKRKFTAVRDY
jgi:pyruvyltransferase